MEKRIEYLDNIHNKKLKTQIYLQSINVFESSKLMDGLKDVFHIYGFSVPEVKRLLKYNGDFSEYSTHQLEQIDGIFNTLLHQLKRVAKASE